MFCSRRGEVALDAVPAELAQVARRSFPWSYFFGNVRTGNLHLRYPLNNDVKLISQTWGLLVRLALGAMDRL